MKKKTRWKEHRVFFTHSNCVVHCIVYYKIHTRSHIKGSEPTEVLLELIKRAVKTLLQFGTQHFLSGRERETSFVTQWNGLKTADTRAHTHTQFIEN